MARSTFTDDDYPDFISDGNGGWQRVYWEDQAGSSRRNSDFGRAVGYAGLAGAAILGSAAFATVAVPALHHALKRAKYGSRNNSNQRSDPIGRAMQSLPVRVVRSGMQGGVPGVVRELALGPLASGYQDTVLARKVSDAREFAALPPGEQVRQAVAAGRDMARKAKEQGPQKAVNYAAYMTRMAPGAAADLFLFN